MARLAESGSWYPGLITLVIAAILAGWAAYALSGAGLLPALPYVRSVLVVITAIYLLRGVAGLLLSVVAPGYNGVAFWVWSSVICLLFGAVHAAGLVKAWPALSGSHT
jgi:hypothetical protein